MIVKPPPLHAVSVGATLCLAAVLLTGCPAQTGNGPSGPGKTAGGSAKQAGAKPKEQQAHHHHHAETGPHGGALVVIGDEAAHVEVTLDAQTGELIAYVYDDEVKKPLWIKQAELTMAITLEGEDKSALPESAVVVLKARETKDGAAHEFFALVPQLKGAEEFDAVLEAIAIDGTTHKSVNFEYPVGNEDHHHHAHDDDHDEKMDGDDHDDHDEALDADGGKK